MQSEHIAFVVANQQENFAASVSYIYSGAAVRRCSSKKVFFCNIYRKTLVLEFLFNKVAGLKV